MRKFLVLLVLILFLTSSVQEVAARQTMFNAFRFNNQEGKITAQLRYNDANLRINQAVWNNETTQSGRMQIFEDSVLIYTLTLTVGTGDVVVPYNYRLVEVTDEWGTYLDLPEGITYRFSWPYTP
jgi:hypothetical protein